MSNKVKKKPEDVYISLDCKESKDSEDLQNVRISYKIIYLLKAQVSDYLQFNLHNGLGAVAKFVLYNETGLIPKKKDGIKIYFASVTNCVVVPSLIDKVSESPVSTSLISNKFSETPTASFENLINLSNIRVLERASIKNISVKLLVSSASDVFKYKTDILIYKSRLRKLLSEYGIINGCQINMKNNILAQALGIESVAVKVVDLCNECLTQERKRGPFHSGFIGCGFIIDNCCSHASSNLDKFDNSVLRKENDNQLSFLHEDSSNVTSEVLTVLSIESKESLMKKASVLQHFGGMEESLKHMVKHLKLKIAQREVLLVAGPVGCGKTTLVTQAATSISAALVIFDCQSLVSLKLKAAVKLIRNKFREAADLSKECKCILLLQHLNELEDPKEELQIITRAVADNLFECMNAGVKVLATTTGISTSNQNYMGPLSDALEFVVLSVGESTLSYRVGIIAAIAANNLEQRHCVELATLLPGYVARDLKHLFDIVQSEWHCGLSSSDYKSLLLRASDTYQPTLVRSSAILGERPVSAALGGMETLQQELRDVVENMMTGGGDVVSKLCGSCDPKGILLYGPPGCGKTQLMCGLAANLGCTFLVVQPKHILSSYVGETEKNLVKVFHSARNARPAIIFFDEIDGLFGDRRSLQTSGVRLSLLTEMLQLMDGVDNAMDEVLVCGATNNPEKLDPALLRPGRFDKLQYVGPPNECQRHEILKIKCQNAVLENPSDLLDIASLTEGYTGADLENIVAGACRAAFIAADRVAATDDKVSLTTQMLRKSTATVKCSLSPEMLEKYKTFCSGYK